MANTDGGTAENGIGVPAGGAARAQEVLARYLTSQALDAAARQAVELAVMVLGIVWSEDRFFDLTEQDFDSAGAGVLHALAADPNEWARFVEALMGQDRRYDLEYEPVSGRFELVERAV